jgi:MinD superfamily P-loop ATPase
LKPRIEASEEVAMLVPEIDESLCDHCGTCARVCAYNALAVVAETVLVFRELCHGCGACSLLCPRGAIREVPDRIGVIESGSAGPIDFHRGRLDVGRALSPPLIRALKKKRDPAMTVIIDAPPGTSCPVVETMRASDFCLLVTEPTPFGLHDLELAAGAAKELRLPRGVLINRADGGEGDARIREFCDREGIPVPMTIPFDRKIAEAYSRGQTLLDLDGAWKDRFLGLFEAIRESVP